MSIEIQTDHFDVIFISFSNSERTKIWHVKTKSGTRLGEIKWYSNWRKYCFFPDPIILDSKCLGLMESILDRLNLQHKEELEWIKQREKECQTS